MVIIQELVAEGRGNKELPAPIYMDGLLKQNLDSIKAKIKQDWDFLYIVDGVEGGGKSVFAQQIAKYCDPSLNLERVCFTADEFKSAVVNADKYQAVIYDEGYGGLNSRQSMSITNRTIISMLAEIRQKNLFVFIVIPSFFDLDRNICLWRAKGLFHIELGKNYERGYFKFYNQINKKYLYIKGKKFYDYRAVMSNLRGRFCKGYVINEEAYRLKKLNSLTKYSPEETDAKMLATFRRELVYNLNEVKDKLGLNQQKLKAILSVNDRTIRTYLHDKREEHRLLKEMPEDLSPQGVKNEVGLELKEVIYLPEEVGEGEWEEPETGMTIEQIQKEEEDYLNGIRNRHKQDEQISGRVNEDVEGKL